MSSSPELLVIGLGNRLRGDDAIGLVLAERLAANNPQSVAVMQHEENDALSLANDLLDHSGPLLIIDCADMGLSPGEWRLFRSGDASLRRRTAGISTHGLGLADALELATALGRQGENWVFGVQPAGLDRGAPLSATIMQKLPEISAALQETIRRLKAE